VEHLGDNDSGVGEGDDEVIKVNLKKVPADVKKIVFTVAINEAEARNQNFGQVQNAFVRLVNEKTNEEVIRYNLTEAFSVETAIIMAELYREKRGWNIKAVGSGYKNGLQGLADIYKTPERPINWRFRYNSEQ
jgi:tellurium resistance protein TerD